MNSVGRVVKGWPGVADACSPLDRAAPFPVCCPPCQYLKSLIRVEGQSLFLNRVLVNSRCFLSAPEHRFQIKLPLMVPLPPHALPRWGKPGRSWSRRSCYVSRAQENHGWCELPFIITPFCLITASATQTAHIQPSPAYRKLTPFSWGAFHFSCLAYAGF